MEIGHRVCVPIAPSITFLPRLRRSLVNMISVPYGLDLNDSVIYAIEKHSMPEMKLRIEQAIRTFEREITENSDNRASSLFRYTRTSHQA